MQQVLNVGRLKFAAATVLALVALVVAYFPATGLRSLVSGADATESHLEREDVMRQAEQWAAAYVAETIATQVSFQGKPISLANMDVVDLRFVPEVREMATSITSGFQRPAPEDVWIVSWERTGVDEAVGKSDGTAYVVVVLRDGTGEVISAAAGTRSPEEQARAREPLPSFQELFGIHGDPSELSPDCVPLQQTCDER